MNIETTPFPLAVRSGQIIDDTSDGDFTLESKFPFVRITNWYRPGEDWMLVKAIKQLGNVEHIVVESVGSMKAIYRLSKEVFWL